MHSCSASSFKYIESLDYEVKAPDGTIFKNHQNIKKPKSYGVKNYLILAMQMDLLKYKKQAMVFGVFIEKCMNFVLLTIKN